MNNYVKNLKDSSSLASKSGPVVYWMSRDMRLESNRAFSRAQTLAIESKKPLLILYNLEAGYLGGVGRHNWFKKEVLEELLIEAQAYNISFQVVFGGVQEVLQSIQRLDASWVVTDMCPLRISKEWLSALVKSFSGGVDLVDAHNLVPVWDASDKKEYGAYTLRPKIHHHLLSGLDKDVKVLKHPYGKASNLPIVFPDSFLKSFAQDRLFLFNKWKPSRVFAKKALKSFLVEKMGSYWSDRNNPNLQGQSGLSPYLHYGVLSAREVADSILKIENSSFEDLVFSKKNGSNTDIGSIAFLEELIIRRELADNFCWYESDYDKFTGFPVWAQTTLTLHKKDKRDYLYDFEDFDTANTHDDLWNSAQWQMITEGKMHGYLRMYWAKKVLEWTSSAEMALDIAIKLNDRYELDGRDPNGYAGIAWSIGGVHDRPWFERPVFGMIRYMALSGMKKKFAIKSYIDKYQPNTKQLSI